MINRKLGALLALIGLFSVTTNAGAAVGENIAQLIARYGEPENGFALILGFGEWETQQGKVIAFLEDGKAALMAYDGVSDEETKNALLERNLPKDEKWVNGKAFKAFVLTHKKSDPNPKEIDQMQFWQARGGKLWASYNPLAKALVIGTPEGIKKMASIAESHESKGF